MEGVMQQQQQEREQDDQERRRSMEKHPRCALLPSPELLAIGMANGSDETNTIDDLYNMLEWFEDAGCLNTGFYKKKKISFL